MDRGSRPEEHRALPAVGDAGHRAPLRSIILTVNRAFRAGESLEDYCRACKTDRLHTVIVVDGTGRPIRVSCDYCDSQHNFRGGPRLEGGPSSSSTTKGRPATSAEATAAKEGRPLPTSQAHDSFPLVADRAAFAKAPAPKERSGVHVSANQSADHDLELLLRRVIREETGLTPVAPAAKWRGGTLVLRPGTPGLQEKSWPIETFFHKVVMLRNRLRTLEQQVNASELPDDMKIKLQGYISGCYGSLTSFNVLFADEADQFKGSGGD